MEDAVVALGAEAWVDRVNIASSTGMLISQTGNPLAWDLK